MRCEDMDDYCDHEKNEQGYVKNVPKPEKALVKRKGRGLLGGVDMLRHKALYAGKLPALNLLRPPTALAFGCDHAPSVCHQPHLNDRAAPTNHRERNEPGESALGGGRAKPRKGIQVRNHPVGNGGVGANETPQFINIGHDLLSLRFASIQPKMDLAVEVLANESASGNDEHRHECDAAVDR